MLKGFKEFISQGNALELAVAVINRCGIQADRRRHH